MMKKEVLEKNAKIFRKIAKLTEEIDKIKTFRTKMIFNFKGFDLPGYVKNEIISVLNGSANKIEDDLKIVKGEINE